MTEESWRDVRRKLRSLGLNREIVLLSSARMADAFCNSVLIVLLPLYVVRIPKSPFFARLPDEMLIGFLVSLAGLMFALMQPVAGAISDRMGKRKPFILGGLGIVTIATLLYIPADSYLALVGLRSLQGLGIAFTIPTSLALIADFAEKTSVGGSMGVFTTARMMGFTAGPLVGGVLEQTISFEAAFIASSMGALLSFVLVFLFVPERRGEADRTHRTRSAGEKSEWMPDEDLARFDGDGKGESTDRFGNDRRLVGWVKHQLYLVGGAVFVMALSISLIAAVEPELNQRLGQTAVGFGIAFSMLTVARFLFQIPIGRLSDRIGRKPLILGGLILLAPLAMLQGLAPSTFWLSADRLLLGVATAMIVAPAYALTADRGLPGLRVRQMSIMTMSFGLGVASGPLLSGALAGIVSFETPFYVSGGLSAAAAALVYLRVEESREPEEAPTK